MVAYLQAILEQWWHKACGGNQATPDLTEGPFHKMEPIPDIAWMTKNQRLAISET